MTSNSSKTMTPNNDNTPVTMPPLPAYAAHE